MESSSSVVAWGGSVPTVKGPPAALFVVDIFSIICQHLSAGELVQVCLLSKEFYAMVKNNTAIWKELFLRKHGIGRAEPLSTSGAKWQVAFTELEKLSSAALNGRWFEYDGYFSEPSAEYDFSLALHSSESFKAVDVAPLPEGLEAKGASILREEQEFCSSFDPARYEHFSELPDKKVLDSVFLRTESYPENCEGHMHSFLISDIFGAHSISAASYCQTKGYRHFFPSVLPSDLWQMRHSHLNTDQNPIISPYNEHCVSVQGVISWTRTNGNMNYFGAGIVAQEFVYGYYHTKDRILYLLGIGRSLRCFDAFLGVDLYKLQLSEDGHSFQGKSFGNADWNNPMRGGTSMFRQHSIKNMMKEATLQDDGHRFVPSSAPPPILFPGQFL